MKTKTVLNCKNIIFGSSYYSCHICSKNTAMDGSYIIQSYLINVKALWEITKIYIKIVHNILFTNNPK